MFCYCPTGPWGSVYFFQPIFSLLLILGNFCYSISSPLMLSSVISLLLVHIQWFGYCIFQNIFFENFQNFFENSIWFFFTSSVSLLKLLAKFSFVLIMLVIAFSSSFMMIYLNVCQIIPTFVSSWYWFSSVQLLSHARLCDSMNRSTPGLPVHHQLPESTQTHVHWVGDAIQPSHPLLSPSPPACNLSQH